MKGLRKNFRHKATTALAILIGLALFSVLEPAALAKVLARTFPPILWRVDTRQPVVALTFDDGPDPVYTPQVLEILARHNARATFFLVGEHARRHPELVAAIRRAGHEVGNHTGTMHTTFFIGQARFEEDLLRAEAALGIGSSKPKFFRPAGGLIRPAQLRWAKRNGYTCVLGSAYAFDPYRPPAGYIRWVIGKSLKPGVIVVLHDSGGNRSNTVAALEAILETGESQGLRWVTLSEMLATAKN